MAGITQTIPNYSVGISEQPDQLKAPGQVVDTVNSIPDLVNGLYKRPGAKRISPAEGQLNHDAPLPNVQSGGSWFSYYRDETEGAYISQVAADGTTRVWSCNDGVEKTVHHGAQPWATNTEYDLDELVQADSKIYTCVIEGTSANSGSGPSGTGTAIVDNTAKWDYVETVAAATTSIKTYLSASNTEDVQALTINDTTFLNNRDTPVTTTSTTDGRPHANFSYIELLRTENGRQYAINLYSNDTPLTSVSRATRVKISADNLNEASGTGHCPGIGTQVFSVSGSDYPASASAVFTTSDEDGTNQRVTITKTGHGFKTGDQVSVTSSAGGFTNQTKTEITRTDDDVFYYVADSDQGDHAGASCTIVSPHVDKTNLIFRLTTHGQQGSSTSRSINNDDKLDDASQYSCSYNRDIILLHGGEGWVTGDKVTVTLDSAQTDYNYTIRIEDAETTQVKATVSSSGDGLIRPAPTPFDSDTAVTVDTVLGGIINELPGSINHIVIGNGLYLYSTSTSFNVEVPDQDLLRVTGTEINDVTALPIQMKHNGIVKIANTRASDEDDYYLKFEGENSLDGSGSWTECAAPGIVKSFNAVTMPHIMERLGDGSFVVKKYTWADRTVGDDTTNPIPSFVDESINKVIFFRNRLAFLSGENIITAQPGNLVKPSFWVDTALTVSAIDAIDISCSSTYPSKLFDAIEIPAGLLCFSTNEQFLFSADAEVMNPDTAKLRAVSMYNYHKTVPPISLGATVGYIDNSNKYSRFMEMAAIAREQEAAVVNTSEVIPTLLPKDLDLIANSRENGIVLLGKTNSDEVVGYRYLNQGENRIQSAWFKWKHNKAIKWHFIVNDEYFFLDTNDFLQKINLVQADADPSIEQDDVNYLLHIDNYTTVANGVYNATTDLTTFTNQSDWIDQVTSPNGTLVVVDNNTNSSRVGRYAECTVINNDDFTLPGDWSSATLNIGYLYEYSVQFPRFYLQKTDGKSVQSDVNSKLTIHRAKINFGKIGLYQTTLKRVGKSDFTQVYESAISNEYNISDAPYLEEEIQEVPVYERNMNIELTLKSSHPAPATLRSLSWEGDYSPMHYRRV